MNTSAQTEKTEYQSRVPVHIQERKIVQLPQQELPRNILTKLIRNDCESLEPLLEQNQDNINFSVNDCSMSILQTACSQYNDGSEL